MKLQDEAKFIDREAEALAGQEQSRFVSIGRVMARMSHGDKWMALEDPRNGNPFTSLESWVAFRFRGQRSWAFAARKVYISLHPNVTDQVMEAIEPGVLQIMAKRLPSSAVKTPEIIQTAMISSSAEFREKMIPLYPDHFADDHVAWKLHPTESQAALYNRVIGKVQDFYRRTSGESMGREEALEHILRGAEEAIDETPVNDCKDLNV